MLRISIRKGLIFIQGQRRFELQRRLPNSKLEFQTEDGERISLEQAEVTIRWLRQEWVVDEASIASMENAIYLAAPRDLRTYPLHQQQIALRRQQYLQAINPEINKYNPSRWKALIDGIAKEIGDRKPPCASSVHAWWQRYRASKSILTLIPHNKPTVGPRSQKVYQIFEEVVSTVYLTTQKLPKTAVVEETYRRIDAVNRGSDPSERIARPSISTLYRWLDDLQQDLVDAAREGAEASRLKHRPAIGTVAVGNILERIEIDHTPLDLIVIDTLTKLPLGRPWLTMAIDVYSRMVVGFYISFNAPSAHGVLQCLRRAVLPKDAWLSNYPDIKEGWPAHGIPMLIVIDNGRDLHSRALEEACREMGIQTLFAGARTPQHKGAIERFFRTLNTGLIHRLPGTVFSSVDARGDYPAEDKAVITMEHLTHLLTKWVVEVYNVTHHRSIGMRPLDMWLRAAERQIIELPAYPQQMEVITGIPAQRTLFHYGIELDGLQYNSELLQTLRRRSGKNLPVPIKFYEDDVGYIHVYDDEVGEYLRVPAKQQGYAAGLPRPIHRLVREHARKNYGDNIHSPQLLQSRAEIESLVQQAIKDKRMGLRKQGAGQLLHDSEAILSGRDPLAEARRPYQPQTDAQPPALPDGLDDDLPDFSAPEGGE